MNLPESKQETERIEIAKSASRQQAAPTGAGDVVLDKVLLVIDRMLVAANSGHEWASGSVLHSDELRRVRKALIDRAEFGEKKYGTKLRMLNGRDATYDLWQELLDAIMYAMQARMEGKPGRHLVELLVGLAGQIEGI